MDDKELKKRLDSIDRRLDILLARTDPKRLARNIKEGVEKEIVGDKKKEKKANGGVYQGLESLLE